mmetsp:Transcript_11501/g.27127  ORF Transcript_11501/g.27127 Transcript_11501/m.27127 type:complete len:230 (-) Transcript_11501:4-693(-)
MRITVRSLNGEAAELDVDPDTTMLGLRQAVQAALSIPAPEQRLIYAGTQLEEFVTPAWRARRSSGALAAALNLDKLPDGTPLTLEHYGIQKGSVLNVVRKVASATGACCGEREERPGLDGTIAFDRTPGAPARPLAQLEALNDLELLVLLRPLLRKRPTLRAALLAEEPHERCEDAWRRGDRCSVWSNSARRWCEGEVVTVADQTSDKIPLGSVEVAFELGRKWVAPTD